MTARSISGWAALGVVATVWAGPAFAQRSLFDAPVETPAPAPPQGGSTGGDTAPKPRPKPRKPRGPVPARSITINNAGVSTLSSLEVSADDKSAKLTKPLAPKTKATLKLPAFKSCTVAVLASFEGQAGEPSEVDICKDKAIRFTE